MIRRLRWRCADPTCPARTWQPVHVPAGVDPVKSAERELERHYERNHKDKESK